MASELKSDIIKVLDQTRDEIRANMQAKGVNASGRTSASLRVEEYATGVRLVGGTDGTHTIPDSPAIYGSDTAPIPTLEVGRKGGDVPRDFYYILRQWSKDKGITFATESERNTFAYFLARKIARTGTRRNSVPEDVYSSPVMNARARIDEILRASMKNTLAAALGGGTVTSLRGAFTN